MKSCQYCEKEFTRISAKAIYCSDSCGKKMRWHKDKERLNLKRAVKIKEKKCKCCGEVFLTKNSKRIYCSNRCLQKEVRVRKGIVPFSKIYQKICRLCKQPFYQSQKYGQKSCSKCLYKKEIRLCLYCLEKFESLNKNNKYCNKTCAIRYRSEYGNTRSVKKKYRDNNKHRARVYLKERYQRDHKYRMSKIMRNHIKRCIVKQMTTSKYLEIFGYNLEELINHLELTYFKNYNKNIDIRYINGTEVHIDHIRPLKSFNFINDDGSTNLDILKQAFELKNLQLLTAKDNISKGSKWRSKEISLTAEALIC